MSQRLRWQLRSHVQRAGDYLARDLGGWDTVSFRRAAGCGRWGLVEGGRVGVHDGGGFGYYSGIGVCGSVWLCPVCTAKIRAARAKELGQAAEKHIGEGGSLLMVTLTVRHHRSDRLATLLQGLSGAWVSLQQSARWRSLREDLVGTVKALEVTVGANGWHPHYHFLLFVKNGRREAVLSGLEAALGGGRWAERVFNRLGKRPTSRGVHIQAVEADAGAYLSKVEQAIGASKEVSRGDYKTREALTVLAEGLGNGEASALGRFIEYAEAMRGKRALVWSRGLREALGMSDELSDEDLAGEEVGAPMVATLAVSDYKVLLRLLLVFDTAVVDLLDLVGAGKLEAAVELAASVGVTLELVKPPDDWPPPGGQSQQLPGGQAVARYYTKSLVSGSAIG